MNKEYIYYNEAVELYPNVDFSCYKESNENGEEVISKHNYYNCLLDNSVEYKDFIIDEVIYEIDNFGYYADDKFEEMLSEVCTLTESNLTPDDIGINTWNALCYIEDKNYKKYEDKIEKRKIKDKK